MAWAVHHATRLVDPMQPLFSTKQGKPDTSPAVLRDMIRGQSLREALPCIHVLERFGLCSTEDIVYATQPGPTGRWPDCITGVRMALSGKSHDDALGFEKQTDPVD